MTLLNVLKLIDNNLFPLTLDEKYNTIDSRPESSYEVMICFMCEEESWITCNIQNEILIPWYDCEVSSIEPYQENILQVWLKHVDYVKRNWPQHLYVEDKNEK